jgi:lysozyme
MADRKKVIQGAAQIVAKFEGFSEKPYWDVDNYSIGYGHHFHPGDGFTKDSVITQQQALALLEYDITRFVEAVEQDVHVQLTDNQEEGLVSLCYNIGSGAFKMSTLVRLLNQGHTSEAAMQFLRWDRVKGVENANLLERRKQEMGIFNA